MVLKDLESSLEHKYNQKREPRNWLLSDNTESANTDSDDTDSNNIEVVISFDNGME